MVGHDILLDAFKLQGLNLKGDDLTQLFHREGKADLEEVWYGHTTSLACPLPEHATLGEIQVLLDRGNTRYIVVVTIYSGECIHWLLPSPRATPKTN